VANYLNQVQKFLHFFLKIYFPNPHNQKFQNPLDFRFFIKKSLFGQKKSIKNESHPQAQPFIWPFSEPAHTLAPL
jgi:hypothetical protein